MANDNSKPQVTPQTIPLAKIHDLPGILPSKPPDKTYGGLVTSIQAGGVKEPVILRLREDGEYQLVTGYRRRRASELAKKTDIPALVYQMTLPEAIAYHRGVQRQANLPVPGKLVGLEEKAPTADSKAVDKAAVSIADDKSKETTTAAKDAPVSSDPDKGATADKVAQTPAGPAKDVKGQADTSKATVSAAGDIPKETAADKEAQTPAGSTKDAKKQPNTSKATPPVTKDKLAEATAAKEAQTPADPAKDKEQAAAPKAGDKPKEAAPAKAPPAAVSGPAAKGPTGTAISKVLDSRLTPPPSEEAKKDFPAPGEGESFFVSLHPAYLVKSEYNIISVDTWSEDYRELRKSIELNGVKDPVLARIGDGGTLEILSGQRRHMIATELNYPVPTIIQKIDDADAKILVSDGNLHRPHISSYDLSRSLRLKMEGMKQKSGRRRKGVPKAEELNSDEKLAQEMGMSVSKLNRILRLSEATKDVCDRVDDGSLHLSIASAISFLTPEHQEGVLHLMDLGYKPSTERIEYMKKVEKWGKLDNMVMRGILEGENVDHLAPGYVPPKAEVVPPSPDIGTGTAQPTEVLGSGPVQSAPAPAASAVNFDPPIVVPAPIANLAPIASPVPTTEAPAVEAPAAKQEEIGSGRQERPEYTKIILTGDRLRKYFPDVSMTPHAIEESIYSALEERRQRQIKEKQKSSILKGKPR
jgi:ParB-like chromosome segregation protein Spo0J